MLPAIARLDDGKYNFKALDETLRAIKMRYPREEDAVLIIEENIFYEDIVSVMDICRDAHFPNIGLSGGIR